MTSKSAYLVFGPSDNITYGWSSCKSGARRIAHTYVPDPVRMRIIPATSAAIRAHITGQRIAVIDGRAYSQRETHTQADE